MPSLLPVLLPVLLLSPPLAALRAKTSDQRKPPPSWQLRQAPKWTGIRRGQKMKAQNWRRKRGRLPRRSSNSSNLLRPRALVMHYRFERIQRQTAPGSPRRTPPNRRKHRQHHHHRRHRHHRPHSTRTKKTEVIQIPKGCQTGICHWDQQRQREGPGLVSRATGFGLSVK